MIRDSTYGQTSCCSKTTARLDCAHTLCSFQRMASAISLGNKMRRHWQQRYGWHWHFLLNQNNNHFAGLRKNLRKTINRALKSARVQEPHCFHYPPLTAASSSASPGSHCKVWAGAAKHQDFGDFPSLFCFQFFYFSPLGAETGPAPPFKIGGVNDASRFQKKRKGQLSHKSFV